MFDRMIMDYNTGLTESILVRINKEFYVGLNGLRQLMGGGSMITPKLLGQVLGSTYGISRDPAAFWHVYSQYIVQEAGDTPISKTQLERDRKKFIAAFVSYLQY